MPKFQNKRSTVVTLSRKGMHVIHFDPQEEDFVPDFLVADALEAGLVAVDDEVVPPEPPPETKVRRSRAPKTEE